MIKFLRKFSNLFFNIRFSLNKIRPKTVLLVEVNNYHAELFPSFVYYLKNLGFNVEIMANFGQIGNLPRLDVKNLYYFSLSGFKKALLSDKIKDYTFIIFLSNEIYWSFKGEINPNTSVFDKFPLASTLKNKTGAVIHDLKEKMPQKDVKKIVLSKILAPEIRNADEEDPFYVINPCYFTPTKPKERTQGKTIFITTGRLEDVRKSSPLLYKGARSLLNSNIKNFEIRVIGDNPPDTVPRDLRGHIKILGKLSFEKMYEELLKADFFLPLLDKNNEKHLRYVTTGTSGSFQLIRGFFIPPVIQKTFGEPHGFNEKNAIIYEDDFSLALKKCIGINEKEYSKLLRNLSKETDEIRMSSVLELKKMLKIS